MNARLQALLSQSKPLQLVKPVLFRRAIQQRVLQQRQSRARMHDRTFHRPPPAIVALGALELPRVAAFVVQQARVVVAFVEVFEHGGEDLWELVGEVNAFGGGFEELAAADGGEEGRGGEDGFVGGEEALFGANAEGDYGRGEGAVLEHGLVNVKTLQRGCLPSGGRAIVGFAWFLGFLASSLLSEGSLGFAGSCGFGGTMLRETLVVMRASCKHGGIVVSDGLVASTLRAMENSSIQRAGNIDRYKCNWNASVQSGINRASGALRLQKREERKGGKSMMIYASRRVIALISRRHPGET